MSVGTILEVVAGFALGIGAVLLYRRRASRDRNHGSQTAVILLVIAAILLIHGFGLLHYHPSPSEIEGMKGGSQ